MANTGNKNPAEETLQVQPAVKQKYPVFIPKMGTNEEPYVLVGVNGVLTQIPRGKPVMVSRAVYEILSRSNTAKEVTEAFLVNSAFKA